MCVLWYEPGKKTNLGIFRKGRMAGVTVRGSLGVKKQPMGFLGGPRLEKMFVIQPAHTVV